MDRLEDTGETCDVRYVDRVSFGGLHSEHSEKNRILAKGNSNNYPII